MQRVYNETVGASADAAFFGSGAVLAYSRTDVKPSSERESLYNSTRPFQRIIRGIELSPQLCLRDCFHLRDFVLSQRVADGAISTRSCVLRFCRILVFNTLTNAHSSFITGGSKQHANRKPEITRNRWSPRTSCPQARGAYSHWTRPGSLNHTPGFPCAVFCVAYFCACRQ